MTSDNTPRRNLRNHGGRLQSALQLLCALSLALGALAGAAHAQSGAQVGEVSLVLGEATRHAADGEVSNLARGMTISVSDRIETRSNGHVHIRFVDNALVSVRPNSRLTIDRYEYDSGRPGTLLGQNLNCLRASPARYQATQPRPPEIAFG